ncbi:MAG: hypothetical protein KBT12_01975 [Bacteroidales bacterium]|nr:hypothetical protein [Candidatus Physcousia equi]
MMKRTMLSVLLAMMVGSAAMAQRQRMTDEERAKEQAEKIEKQTTRISKELKLEGDAKTAFETSYRKYMEEIAEATKSEGGRRGNVDVDELSDDECYAKITEHLTQQEKQIEQMQKRLEITKKYVAELLPTLTAKQLYKVFGQPQRNNFERGNFDRGNNGGNRGGFGGGGFGGGRRGF